MHKEYTTLLLEIKEDTGIIWLNRPNVRNAFNEQMISEIIRAVAEWEQEPAVRFIILRGKGNVFCAGADLNWMRSVKEYTYERNYEESYQLSNCFYALYTCTKPTIAVVHGASIGGANGLLAACDFAYCEEDTIFSLSEVKIGIVPACISPYVVKRVGEYAAKELMLTGKRFNGEEAEKKQLVNMSVANDQLNTRLEELLDQLRSSGPMAMSHCKKLVHDVCNVLDMKEALSYTARMIAKIRSSEEGQEGMSAFLEKRKPNWIIKK